MFKEPTKCTDRWDTGCERKVVIDRDGDDTFCGEDQEIIVIQVEKVMPMKYPNSDGE